MKKPKRRASLFVLLLASATIIGQECNAQGKKLIHYWHFNNTVTGQHLGAVPADYSTLGKAIVIYKPKPGGGSDTTQAYMDNVTGDTINQRRGYGGCCGTTNYGVRPRNPSDNMQFLWYIPTNKYQNIVIKYETQTSSTASGQHRQVFSYSCDSAATFSSAGLPVAFDSAGVAWGKVTLDLSSLSNVNNNRKFVFRILFAAPNTGTSGNNRFDNITIEGDTMTAPAITSNPMSTGILGKLYSYTIVTSGSPAPTLSVSGNPSWLTLSGNTLSGIPASKGTVGPVTITASNIIGTVQQQFSLVVADSINPVAPKITSTAPSSVKAGLNYSYTVRASGVPKPSFSVIGNPSWLSINDSILSGSTTANGIYGPFKIAASNVAGTDTQTVSITVTRAPLISSEAITSGVVNVPYSYTLNVTGTPAPGISISGNPAWMSLNGNVISGTPLATGTFGPVTVTASNTEGTAQQVFSVDVASVPVITSTPVIDGTAGSLYTYAIAVSGTPSPQLSVSGNPAWLNLNGNTLSGIPASSGLIGPVTIVATNVAATVKQTYYLNISGPSVNTGSSRLLYYWHFNNTNPQDGSGGINYASQPMIADYSFSGSGSLIYRALPGVKNDIGVLDNYTGDTINQRRGYGGCCSDINNSVRMRNPSDSMELLLYLPTSKYRNIVIRYETELSSLKSGQHEQIFSYSSDSAATFLTSGLPLISNFADTIWKLVTIDLRSLSEINNNDKFVFRINFSTPNTGDKGNNRFDNLTVEGESIISDVGETTFTAGDFSLFPNPASDHLVLSGKDEMEKNIYIYNSTGTLVRQVHMGGREVTIDISGLSSGLYFLKVMEQGMSKAVTL